MPERTIASCGSRSTCKLYDFHWVFWLSCVASSAQWWNAHIWCIQQSLWSLLTAGWRDIQSFRVLFSFSYQNSPEWKPTNGGTEKMNGKKIAIYFDLLKIPSFIATKRVANLLTDLFFHFFFGGKNLISTYKISSCVNKFSSCICSYSGNAHSLRYSTNSAIFVDFQWFPLFESQSHPKILFLFSKKSPFSNQPQNQAAQFQMKTIKDHSQSIL